MRSIKNELFVNFNNVKIHRHVNKEVFDKVYPLTMIYTNIILLALSRRWVFLLHPIEDSRMYFIFSFGNNNYSMEMFE